MRLSRRTVVAALGGATALGVAGATTWADGGDESPTVDALVAGSLLELASTVPGATVEAHGSAAVRRLIVEGIRDPDAVALADPLLFDGVSDRATLFATNALVLTHAPETPVADALREDWRGTLERPDVRVGRTDPTLDPLGYRTVMALRLTARRREFDADAVLTESTVFPETDLLNAVEGGAVDSAVTYRNMAVQRDLPYQELPASVDFSDPAHVRDRLLRHRGSDGAGRADSVRRDGHDGRGRPVGRGTRDRDGATSNGWVQRPRVVPDAPRCRRWVTQPGR